MGNKAEIAKALAVTAEITGTTFSSREVIQVMVDDLAEYETSAVLNALNRCRRELTGRLTLAAVIERIETGLPSADEAWGLIVEGLKNEALTVVVPAIAQQAAGNGAATLFANGDKTGARMAFREAYNRLAAETDLSGGVQWAVSRGYDANHAEAAILEAVRKGRLKKEQALQALPYQADDARELIERGRVLSPEDRRRGKQMIAKSVRMQTWWRIIRRTDNCALSAACLMFLPIIRRWCGRLRVRCRNTAKKTLILQRFWILSTAKHTATVQTWAGVRR